MSALSHPTTSEQSCPNRCKPLPALVDQGASIATEPTSRSCRCRHECVQKSIEHSSGSRALNREYQLRDKGRIPSEIVEALYRTADALEVEWRRARLPLGFRDQQVDGVIRFLKRHSLYRIGQVGVSGVIRRFWKRNARKTLARRSVETEVQLEEHLLPPVVQEFESEIRSKCLWLLINSGVAENVAVAFMLHLNSLSSEEISRALTLNGFPTKPATVRQWNKRHFKNLLATLRSHRTELGHGPIGEANVIRQEKS
jgi:hypothetical protein